MPKVVVMRMCHRPFRDRRVTTHVGLVARAFGADGIILADTSDKNVVDSLEKVVELWGGPFFVKSGLRWKEVMRKWKSSGGVVVHLTMYGLPVEEAVEKVRGKDVLLVVGAEKMPTEAFELADVNVSVGNQPHSEVAAVAILLDRIHHGAGHRKEFKKWKLKVTPSERGKRIDKA